MEVGALMRAHGVCCELEKLADRRVEAAAALRRQEKGRSTIQTVLLRIQSSPCPDSRVTWS